MTSKVSVVNWDKAPADAQFYSMYYFRKHENGKEYLLEYGGWREVKFDDIETHKLFGNFEMRPHNESLDDKWDNGELGQSEDNVVVVSDHIAELASQTLKECVEGKHSKLAAAAAEMPSNGGTTMMIESAPIKCGWTATHYDNYYHLTEADIKSGKIRVDAYFVNKLWKLNEKDDTGVLFHSLKTIARFGDKNPIEREIKALYHQTKRMAELYGVDLEC